MEILTREEVATAIMQISDPYERDKAAEYALKLYGPAPQRHKFAPYTFDPIGYIRTFLYWDPWEGQGDDLPGQVEVIRAYTLALRQQFEKRDFQAGRLKEKNLKYWKPDQIIQNIIRVEAGHTVGKTKLASGLISHFHDCLGPSVANMYAPTGDTLRDNLWEELKQDRIGKDLPGRILGNVEIRTGPNHYIKGRATSNAHGKGTERIQGKHGEKLLFALDEAEGVEDYVFAAIDSMMSGGITIAFMIANPKTRTSKFHRIKDNSNVRSFRMSCLNHPNVVAGREIVPNAIQREYVRSMIEQHCEVVQEEDPDSYTFQLDWEVRTKTHIYPPGTWFKPDNEFLWRVLGIAPSDISDKTVIPPGRYLAAVKRTEVVKLPQDEDRAIMGIDVARFGTDFGTLYVRRQNEVWRARQFYNQDSKVYFHGVKDEAMRLSKLGVKRLSIRVDAGGDSSGLIDTLRHSMEMREAFPFFDVIAVPFGGAAKDAHLYDDAATEMYFAARETLLGLRLINPPETLESDLTLREWEPVNRGALELKRLQDKKAFRKVINRSPDDGDGFVLCVAPDRVIRGAEIVAPVAVPKTSIWG